MYNPVSTYRLQFSKDFSLKELKPFIEYLYNFGIKTIYASPILGATSASEHGYDVVNPFIIHSAIGSEKQFLKLHQKLQDKDMGWLQDIVPNHMAYSTQNPWIFDMLEKGIVSTYADYFDVDWNYNRNTDLIGKISLPFFGDDIEFLIKNKELFIDYNEKSGLHLKYYENEFPVSVETYHEVLQNVNYDLSDLKESVEKAVNPVDRTDFYKRFDHLKNTWLSMYTSDKEFKVRVTAALSEINDDEEALFSIIFNQNYLPEYWETTNRRINYRRFFTINDMICLNMDKLHVFEHYHRYIVDLVEKGIFTGLRIDHIDGLFYPGEYLDRLRRAIGEDTYLIVEKILEKDEEIPSYWPVQGTTGYHFLALCNNLLTNNDAAPVFNGIHEAIGGKRITDYEKFSYNKKKFILYQRMHGELDNLTQLCLDMQIIGEVDNKSQLKEAIAEIMIQCPVYKLYFEKEGIYDQEQDTLEWIFNQAKKNKPGLQQMLEDLFNAIIKVNDISEKKRANIMHFLRRLMQFTGPLTAKGIEDTSFYTYNLFIAHNEVGDSPDYYGISHEEFHEAMMNRQKKFPLALNASSTHDTKRGEDFRARLNVLSDFASQWKTLILKWNSENKRYKTKIKNKECPSANDEYFIYQSLIGGFPVDIMEVTTFIKRFKEYIIKSIREGKENSSWVKPDQPYETGILQFIDSIIQTETPFFESFFDFYRKVKDFGYLNSLSQVVLKCMCPGIPDIYQGCEFWNFSMVDPDNRRKVDYKYRKKVLKEISSRNKESNILKHLWEKNDNGKIKFYMTHKLLQERAINSDVFTYGGYIPLVSTGEFKNYLFGFLRKYKNSRYLVAVPMHLAVEDPDDFISFNWKSTSLSTDEDITGNWTNIFNNQFVKINNKCMARDVFKTFPIAVLKQEVYDG